MCGHCKKNKIRLDSHVICGSEDGTKGCEQVFHLVPLHCYVEHYVIEALTLVPLLFYCVEMCQTDRSAGRRLVLQEMPTECTKIM